MTGGNCQRIVFRLTISSTTMGGAVAESVVLFENRMGIANWAFMALGFAVAAALLIVNGTEPLTAIAICAGLAVVTIGIVLGLITLVSPNQVAAISRRGDLLEVEAFNPFGRGRIETVPLAATEDWRLTRLWPTLRFRHDGRDRSLPLRGARIDWPALRAIAPGLREVMR